MISYAQNCEDVLIQRFFTGQPSQIYIDVGAGHHTFHSVTRHFYDSGWSGINIEPRRRLWQELMQHRTRDINLNVCLSDKEGQATFYNTAMVSDGGPDNGGISTLDPKLAEQYRLQGCSVEEQSIAVQTLSKVLESYSITEIGFLKIDVEGHELEVVRGLDWRKWRPRLVIIERTLPFSRELASPEAVEFVLLKGYVSAYFDGLNQYLVRYEDRAMIPTLSVQPNIFDGYVTHAQAILEARVRELEAGLQLATRKQH